MAKSHFYTLGGTDFEGRTKTEAKDAAMDAAAKAFTGEYTPRVLIYRGHTLIVYRAPAGWLYRIIEPEQVDGTMTNAYAWYSGGPETLEEALKRGIEHLVQQTWQHHDGISVPHFVKDDESRSELSAWQKFQLRFKYFREQGHDHDACHRMACDSRYVTE